MADAAGLLKPKLKPVVEADVVAGVPVGVKKETFYHNCVRITPLLRIPKSL